MTEYERTLGLTHPGEPHEFGEWEPYPETMTFPLPDPFPAKSRRCCIKEGCLGSEFKTEMVPSVAPEAWAELRKMQREITDFAAETGRVLAEIDAELK